MVLRTPQDVYSFGPRLRFLCIIWHCFLVSKHYVVGSMSSFRLRLLGLFWVCLLCSSFCRLKSKKESHLFRGSPLEKTHHGTGPVPWAAAFAPAPTSLGPPGPLVTCPAVTFGAKVDRRMVKRLRPKASGGCGVTRRPNKKKCIMKVAFLVAFFFGEEPQNGGFAVAFSLKPHKKGYVPSKKSTPVRMFLSQ